jgi:parallel beta helix pectate lyase-like protein
MAVGAAVACSSPGGRPPERSVLHATPSTLERVFASARGGDTILLAPGDYGRFAAGEKRATVTMRPASSRPARMYLSFYDVADVRIEGLTIDGADIGGRSHDVTIARSTFTKAAVIHAQQMVDARVVLESNRFANIDVCPRCYTARVHVAGSSGRPSGIVIRSNVLGPGGDADGVQVGAVGVQVLGNTFVGIHQIPGDPAHTDALQLYGQSRTVVRGNYFHDVADGIMAPDGARGELIENNVFDTGGYPFAITLGGDRGSVIRHNTVPAVGRCAWRLPCGTVRIGAGHDGEPSRGTVIVDNVLGSVAVSGGSRVGVQHDNLVAAGGGAPGDLVGRPRFVGGADPTSRTGFRLAAGSPGVDAGSDGHDVGIAPR